MNKLLLLLPLIFILPIEQNYTQALDCSEIQELEAHLVCIGQDTGFLILLRHFDQVSLY
jgi:hypothetical protein